MKTNKSGSLSSNTNAKIVHGEKHSFLKSDKNLTENNIVNKSTNTRGKYGQNDKFQDATCRYNSQLNISSNKRQTVVPPDGGWGWLVCAASFVINVLLASLSTIFGILFYSLIKELKLSAATTAWIFNLHAFLLNIGAFLSGPLSDKFSWRSIAMTGGFMASLSIFISGFATSALYLFLSFGIIGGLGSGLCITVSILVTPRYFERWRGLATSTLVSGVSAGHFLAPLLVKFLIQQEGFFGGAIIYSAILLNCCAAAAVFHPVRWHAKNLGSSDDAGENKAITFNRNNVEIPRNKLLKVQTIQSPIYLSQNSIVIIENTSSLKRNKTSYNCTTFCNYFAEIASTVIDYLKILQYYRALVIAFGMGCFVTSYINFLMIIPFTLQQKGFSLDQAAWAVSTSAISNFIFRITSSTVSDHPKFNKKLCYMSGALITCIASIVFPFVTSYPYILVTMIIWGSGLGLNMGLYTLVMIQFMGIDLFPKIMGVTSLLMAFSFLTLGPIIGFIKDVTGDYNVSIFVLGGIIGCNFLLWTLMPLAVKLDAKKDEVKTSSNSKANNS